VESTRAVDGLILLAYVALFRTFNLVGNKAPSVLSRLPAGQAMWGSAGLIKQRSWLFGLEKLRAVWEQVIPSCVEFGAPTIGGPGVR
jgi:hypothetical protein